MALLSVNLLLCFGFYMLPATMPAYVKQIGGTNFEASLVIGMFSIMSLVSRVISGTVVDAVGEKKITLTGIVIIVATTLSFIWMPVDGILLLRSLQGVGWGLSSAAIATAVYKVVPETRRGEGGWLLFIDRHHLAVADSSGRHFVDEFVLLLTVAQRFSLADLCRSAVAWKGAAVVVAGRDAAPRPSPNYAAQCFREGSDSTQDILVFLAAYLFDRAGGGAASLRIEPPSIAPVTANKRSGQVGLLSSAQCEGRWCPPNTAVIGSMPCRLTDEQAIIPPSLRRASSTSLIWRWLYQTGAAPLLTKESLTWRSMWRKKRRS